MSNPNTQRARHFAASARTQRFGRKPDKTMNQSSQPTPPSKEAIECAKAICYSLNVDYSNTTALRVQLAIDKAIKEGGYVKEESYIEIDKYIKEAQENQQLLSLLHAKDEALKEVQRNYGLELSAEHLRQVDSALSLTPSDAAKMFVPVESVEKLCEEVAYMATEMHDSDDEEDKRLALGWMKLVGAIRKRYVTSPPAPPSAHPAGPVPPP